MKRLIGWLGIGVLAVVVGSCDDNGVTCGTGTKLQGNTCVATGGMAMCGTNTAADSSQTCQLQSSACGPGTVLNAMTSTCELNTNHGTMIWTSTHDTDWSLFFYQAPVDGGTGYLAIGTEAGPMSGIADSTLMYAADG